MSSEINIFFKYHCLIVLKSFTLNVLFFMLYRKRSLLLTLPMNIFLSQPLFTNNLVSTTSLTLLTESSAVRIEWMWFNHFLWRLKPIQDGYLFTHTNRPQIISYNSGKEITAPQWRHIRPDIATIFIHGNSWWSRFIFPQNHRW